MLRRGELRPITASLPVTGSGIRMREYASETTSRLGILSSTLSVRDPQMIPARTKRAAPQQANSSAMASRDRHRKTCLVSRLMTRMSWPTWVAYTSSQVISMSRRHVAHQMASAIESIDDEMRLSRMS